MQIHLDELEALYGNGSAEVISAGNDLDFLPSAKKGFSFPKLSRPKFALPKLNVIAELKTLVILFIIVFSGFFFFTNAQLVFFTINDTFAPEAEVVVPELGALEEHASADQLQEKEEKLKELEEQFVALQETFRPEKTLAPTMKTFLDQKQETHGIDFNTLPPSDRLIIPDLNLNIPLIDVPVKGEEDFSEGQFDAELMQGAVKYPTTPMPGAQGNTLIFGHSSTEWRKHNEYGFIFRNLPKLQVGQRFQIVWKGQLMTYEMVERKIVLPKQVSDYYHEIQEQEGSFVTLMGCYPIGSNAKRIMVVAKQVDND